MRLGRVAGRQSPRGIDMPSRHVCPKCGEPFVQPEKVHPMNPLVRTIGCSCGYTAFLKIVVFEEIGNGERHEC